jgi:hypothetical protein
MPAGSRSGTRSGCRSVSLHSPRGTGSSATAISPPSSLTEGD